MECILTDDLSTTDVAALEYRVYAGRVYYTGRCLTAIQHVVCPDPWRAPSIKDLEAVATYGWEEITTAWGWPGVATGSIIMNLGFSGRIFSSEYLNEIRTNRYMRWTYEGAVIIADTDSPHASEVRCVK
jgi:hypothetical protein